MPRARKVSAPANAAAATASQPDIEDLIKSEESGAAVCNGTAFSTQHDAVRHDFEPHELLATRTELLAWYDAHRRKLPWRGDPPPYLTTATHTSQKKKQKKSGLDAFLKTPVKQEEEVAEQEVANDGGNEVAPGKVAPYETWVSEIMLQQTRVDTVVEYFLRWIDKFPTVAALAEANEEVRCCC
ncbi:unnamed protein product [Phytophthora lilii]|uniref:Unnamed protein product n=1 Tax=Phytophthora lilii TaxID=2077276 RepID=A0A9W6YKJ2_9STRA|nr:unnamed protein product [Phytophthora lilii]